MRSRRPGCAPGYLPDPYRADVRGILVDYTGQRLDLVDPLRRADALARSRELARALWAQAEDVTRANPDSPSVVLFDEAVNETIDIGARRAIALATWQLPWTVWLSAYLLAFTGMVLVGFNNGVHGDRNLVPTALLALIFAIVMSLIIDLDRPDAGGAPSGPGCAARGAAPDRWPRGKLRPIGPR